MSDTGNVSRFIFHDPDDSEEVKAYKVKELNKEIARIEKIITKQEDEGVYDETLYSQLDELVARRDKIQYC